MQIRVLGCSGSIAAGSRTTSFLLDDDVLIDAGTGVGDLALDELARIDHILLTHSHLDHVLGIGLLADSVARQRRRPIRVHALPATLEALRKHIFNGIIWPDFTRLPSAERPLLEFLPFSVGEGLTFGDRRVEVLPAEHTVPAVGFAVTGTAGGKGAWVFTGDTGPNPALWRRLTGLTIAHLVIETAFSDDEQQLARISSHLCPTTLAQELSRLEGEVAVHITHIKPGEVDAVMDQIDLMPMRHHCAALTTGQVFEL
ncbi:MAG: 3',5'-cyclic-nucleotide phosphodiesterase [Aquincola sp.]|nr:3',5'-cyclic-nucleotide phosphodiesterase [Aquincola sp.]MDH5331080.1 3',5'-cyclic-nucleotide phosphodiesterase [Aquincola sp.]